MQIQTFNVSTCFILSHQLGIGKHRPKQFNTWIKLKVIKNLDFAG